MGVCKFCGKSAGFLKSEHKDCKSNFVRMNKNFASVSQKYLSSNVDGIHFAQRIVQEINPLGFTENTVERIIETGFTNLIDGALEDGIISENEEQKIIEFINGFEIKVQEKHPILLEKIVKSAIIRDLANSVYISRVNFDGNLPVKLQKNETILWIFSDVEYWEEKFRTHYVGGSTGIMVPIAGTYIRLGAHKGKPVQTAKLEHTDVGGLVITSKHLHFVGMKRRFRIPHTKIISVDGSKMLQIQKHKFSNWTIRGLRKTHC